MLLLEVHRPDGVVLGIRHVERVAVEAHALGPVESALPKSPSTKPSAPGADRDGRLALEVRLDDPVVARVGDEEAIARLVGEHLAGEEERA